MELLGLVVVVGVLLVHYALVPRFTGKAAVRRIRSHRPYFFAG